MIAPNPKVQYLTSICDRQNSRCPIALTPRSKRHPLLNSLARTLFRTHPKEPISLYRISFVFQWHLKCQKLTFHSKDLIIDKNISSYQGPHILEHVAFCLAEVPCFHYVLLLNTFWFESVTPVVASVLSTGVTSSTLHIWRSTKLFEIIWYYVFKKVANSDVKTFRPTGVCQQTMNQSKKVLCTPSSSNSISLSFSTHQRVHPHVA